MQDPVNNTVIDMVGALRPVGSGIISSATFGRRQAGKRFAGDAVDRSHRPGAGSLLSGKGDRHNLEVIATSIDRDY